jgi:hypothetical protein
LALHRRSWLSRQRRLSRFIDRLKDMCSAAMRIFRRKKSNRYYSHRAVAESAVIAVPDQIRGR